MASMKRWPSRPRSRDGAAGRPYSVIESHQDVAELAALALDSARREPLAVLTSRPGEGEPSLEAEHVRTIVGDAASIYFLPTGGLSMDLSERLPDHRGPYNGSVKVWLPGFSAGSDRREHPQVYDPTGEYEPRTLRQLAYGLREAFLARGVEPQVDPLLAYRSLEIVRVLDESDQATRRHEQQLERVRKEREQALEQARLAEHRRRMAERNREQAQIGDGDPEGALRLLILQRWLETLSLKERARNPLGRFLLDERFVRSAEELTYLLRDRLAFVCAMIACERVDELAAIVRGPLPRIPDEDAQSEESAPRDQDGAAAWQCSLARPDVQTPPAVRYLKLADGTVEFIGLADYEIPAGIDARRPNM